jgi:L,D-transpeptidase catalytic domain
MRITKTIIALAVILLGSMATIRALQVSKLAIKKELPKTETISDAVIGKKIKERATALKVYLKTNGYNEEYCFIINMAIPSGKKRFFVYNLKSDSIEHSGLVAHGSGSETKKRDFVFKNDVGSLASAKGKYKIGNSYNGTFGLAYKLHGLDATNNKAFERFIVLHSHDCIPDKEITPLPICVSWGCPTVSPSFLKILQKKIDASTKPVLLDMQYMK